MELFRNNALSILKQNGINDPKPGMWYKQQDWLNAFKDIASKVGASTLNNIGRKILRTQNGLQRSIISRRVWPQ